MAESKLTTKRRPRRAPASTNTSPKADPSTDPATAYAQAIDRGDVAACNLVRLACRRHLTDLVAGERRGLHFDPVVAVRAIRFYQYLRHSKGEWAGHEFELAPWQKFIIGSVYGWIRADGTRRFRTVYNELPRKNGKSSLLAGIGIKSLVADKEPGAEVYTAATRKEQAHIIFDEAKRMVRGSPELSQRIGIYRSNMSIDSTASKFEPLSADERTLDGLNPHVVLIDELHKHKNRGVLDVLDTAMGSRRQPILWIITTAGDDMPESVYDQEHEYAVKVLEGVFDDDGAFVFITTIDKDDRWDDPKVWIKANPNLGVSVKLDDLKRQALKAKNSPSAQVEFKRLRLNLRTASADRYIDMDVWAKNSLCPTGMPRIGYQAELAERFLGRPFFGGLDLSSKIDLSAWLKLFPPQEDGDRWHAIVRFWMPMDTIEEKSDRDRVQYARWVAEGWIDVTQGNVIDHNEIGRVIIEDCNQYVCNSAAFDPWNATQLANGLISQGIPMHEFIQGIRSYTAPTKELEALLLSANLDHGGNPVLAWMASNLRVQEDKNTNRMPNKRLSRGRIDGLSALIMAIGRSMLEDESPYADGRSLLMI